MKKWADVRINVTVMFDDEGEDDLSDLAFEAAIEKIKSVPWTMLDGIEVDNIRDTEWEEAK